MNSCLGSPVPTVSIVTLKRICSDGRLVYWSHLLRGEFVSIDDLDQDLLPMVRGAAAEERKAYVLLRACCELAGVGSASCRRNLRVAILYWFSNMGNGSEYDKQDDTPLAEMDLHRVVGMKLSWREAAAAFGANPNDYSAYHRLLAKLKQACDDHWRKLYGSALSSPFEVPGGKHESA